VARVTPKPAVKLSDPQTRLFGVSASTFCHE
jgi:hypothetical protein